MLLPANFPCHPVLCPPSNIDVEGYPESASVSPSLSLSRKVYPSGWTIQCGSANRARRSGFPTENRPLREAMVSETTERLIPC